MSAKRIFWLFTIICALKLIQNFPAQQEIDQFKRDFGTLVAVPYKQAVTIFADQVIKSLADSPVPPNPQAARPLVNSLTQLINQMAQQVNAAYSGSEALRLRLDKSLESYVAQHSQTQQQLNNAEVQLNQINVQIQSADNQIATAQEQVNVAENSLRAAEQAVSEAERKVDRARNCIIRGKRSFFKKIGRGLKKIVNAPCHVVNHGGIQRAKNGRGAAQRNRDEAVQRLQSLQNTKAQLINQRDASHVARQQLIQKRDSLQVSVQTLSQAKAKVVELGQKLRNVVEHVGAFKVRSDVMRETVAKLVDAETLLIPFESAAALVVDYTGDLGDSNFYQTIKQHLASNVEILRNKLPQYPILAE